MLVGWGTTLADGMELPCYLEASTAGRGLYASVGFDDVETLDMDMSKWGGEGIYHQYVMVRPPNIAKGISDYTSDLR